MQFICDENITRKVSELFQGAGHDIETVQSLNLQGMKNSKLLERTIELNRILITFDTDFAQISIKKFPGILLIRIQPNTDHFVIPVLRNLLLKIKSVDFTNKIVILEEKALFY